MSTLTLPVSHFRLHDIAHSGQVFRWQPMGPDGYLLLSGRRAALARQPQDGLLRLPPFRPASSRTRSERACQTPVFHFSHGAAAPCVTPAAARAAACKGGCPPIPLAQALRPAASA